MSPRTALQAGPGTPPACQRAASHFDLSPNPSVALGCAEGFLGLPPECMNVCSAPPPADPAAVSPPAGEALLEALAASQTAAAVDLVVQCGLAGSWPTGLSPEACIFAACKLQQAAVVEALLAAGAPPHFLMAAALQERDLQALQGSGISADGAGHMTPLAMSVRQRSLEVSRLLLQWGASPDSSLNNGIPLLLHLADALGAAPLPSSSHSSGGSAGTADSSTPWREHSTASSSSWCPAWQAAAPGGIQAAACSALAAVVTGVAGQGRSDAGSRVRGLLEAAEQRLQLLHLLLQHQADPLEAALPPAPGQPTFLTACQDPALLRLAVNTVRDQCQAGRQLTDVQAAQLVDAAGRAFLGGF